MHGDLRVKPTKGNKIQETTKFCHDKNKTLAQTRAA